MKLGTALTVLGSLLLAGCGQYLGSYSVVAVRLVDQLALPFGKEVEPYGQYLEVELSSTTSLHALNGKIDAVYIDADFCPIRDRNRIVALGPVDDKGRQLRVWESGASRQSDGRFHYRVYIVPAHPMPGVRYSSTAMERPRYDIRAGSDDICLRLFAPGYNLTPSRSDTIRIPGRMIAAALK